MGGYLYFRLDDEIRRQVERRLAEHYRDFDVRVGSARFDADRGIAIGGLTLTSKTPDGTSQPVLGIEEMYLAGKMRMDQLVVGQMQIDDVMVRGAKLRLVRDTNGQWNARALLPLPHFGKQSPRVKIEDASGTIEDAASPAAKPWSISGVNLALTPAEATASADADAKRFSLEGTMTGLPAKEIQLKGEIGTGSGAFDMTVTALGFEVSPEILANLPSAVTAKLRGVEASGRADLAVRVARTAADAAIGWSASFKVDRGRVQHPMLPEALADVGFAGHADPNHLVVDHLIGKCGSATISAAIDRAGWSEGAPLGLAVKVVGLTVDERFQAGLPETYARIWDRFKPKGLIDAEARLSFDGEKWRPVLAADCRGISLTDAEKFPYMLEQTTGRVEYHPAEPGRADRLTLDLTGVGGGRPVKVEVDLTNLARPEAEGITTGTGVASAIGPQEQSGHAAGYRGVRGARDREGPPPHPIGFVKVSGTDIPIHEQLLAALPPNAQPFVRSLQPQGTVDFLFRAEWKDASQSRAEVLQEVRLKDCRIQFARFKYPLQRVRGLAVANNWRWKLTDIEGQGVNDSTIVKCRGEANPNGDGYDADLTIDASDVPLDDTLKLSLTAAGQQAWDELRPQGRVDFTAHAKKLASQAEPTIEVVLRPRAKTVSIEPRAFPYRLEQIDGQITYRHDHLELQKVVAHHDRTIYSAESGVWQAAPDGSWQVGLSNVNADRLALTRDLLVALPPAMQVTIDRFQPSGTFGLFNSTLTFSKSPQAGAVAAAWDVNLECQQASIQGSMPLRGMTGGIRLVGRCDGRTAVTAGEMAIDSLLWKDTQLTNIHGPLWCDSAQLLLGEPACQLQNQPPRRLTADAYGGSVATNIEMRHGPTPSYKLDLRVGAASLARFANERFGGPTDLSGTVSGTLIVSGSGQTTQTLSGAGEMHVVDAHIYQIPVLVSLLSVLKNKTPDTTAFNRCDMKFAIQGENVHFEQLNLLGDAVSLYGNGDAKFNRTLDLVFYTLIGAADLPIPLWKTIAGHVSQQSWQLKVVGTLDNPKIERKALPAVNDMLDHIQSELQEGAATMSPNAAVRPRSPAR